ncbi:hypothetical protein OAJ91_01505 [Flavobacteriaceae bacterium]|nr:hypothetical protein [Flavobacteriaceae bacterium]
MFKIFSLLLFFISSQNSAISATYYFDSVNGSDLNQGISSEKPFRTLNKINEIDFNSGDSILLSNGSYFSGNIKLIDKNDIHISNYNNQEKTYPIINSKGHIAGVYIENSSNISVTNIQVTANGGGVIEEYENLSTNKITDKAIMRAGILVNVSKKKIFKNILIDNVIVSDVFFEDLGFKRDPSEVRTSMGTQAYGFGIRFF